LLTNNKFLPDSSDVEFLVHLFLGSIWQQFYILNDREELGKRKGSVREELARGFNLTSIHKICQLVRANSEQMNIEQGAKNVEV
jgi:hypothetical protein